MADNVSPLNLTAGEPVSPAELETQADPYGIAKGRILYEAQIQKLMNALDRRRQLPFDPMLMRVAAGFLKPTKTGAFGESLGYAAEGAAEEAEKEAARRTDVEKMKLELAAKQYDLAQQFAGQQMLGETLRGAPTGTPTAPAGAPTEGVAPTAPADNMTTEQVVSVVQKNPNALDRIKLTPERVAAISSISPAYGKMAEQLYKNQVEQAKLEMSRYEYNAQGDIFDKSTGKVVQYGSRMVEVASPFDPDVKMPIRAADLDSYNSLDFNNPSAVNKWMKKHGLGAFAIGAESVVSGEEGAPEIVKGKTKSERETEKELKVERAKEDIKKDADAKEKIFGNQSASVELLTPNASALYRYATNPETANAFGYLSKQGLLNAAVSLAENGVTIGNWRIGLTDVSDTLRKLKYQGATQKDIETLQATAQYMARLELGFSQAFKGQGQVSDFERKIVQNIGPQKADTAKVIALKSEMILARAKMDDMTAQMYQEWSKTNPSGLVSQFKNSPEYRKMVRQYNTKLEQIQDKYGY